MDFRCGSTLLVLVCDLRVGFYTGVFQSVKYFPLTLIFRMYLIGVALNRSVQYVLGFFLATGCFWMIPSAKKAKSYGFFFPAQSGLSRNKRPFWQLFKCQRSAFTNSHLSLSSFLNYTNVNLTQVCWTWNIGFKEFQVWQTDISQQLSFAGTFFSSYRDVSTIPLCENKLSALHSCFCILSQQTTASDVHSQWCWDEVVWLKAVLAKKSWKR